MTCARISEVKRRLIEGKVLNTRVVKRDSTVSTARSNKLKLRLISVLFRVSKESKVYVPFYLALPVMVSFVRRCCLVVSSSTISIASGCSTFCSLSLISFMYT